MTTIFSLLLLPLLRLMSPLKDLGRLALMAGTCQLFGRSWQWIDS